jgi:hypothetical protein
MLEEESDTETKTDRVQKALIPVKVEECFVLAIGDLGRGLLRRAPEQAGTVSSLYVQSHGSRLYVAYFVSQRSNRKVSIGFARKNKVRVQSIALDWRLVGFGRKPFFLCGFCSSLRSKLYLRPDEFHFFCRKCGELTYELQHINRRGGLLAELHYRLNRALKLEGMAGRIRYRRYKGKVSSRVYRWAVARQKWLGSSAVKELEQKQATCRKP